MLILKVLVLSSIFFVAVNCQSNNAFSEKEVPVELLNETKFVTILRDVLLLEAKSNIDAPTLLHTQKVMKISCSEIFKKHRITKKQFEESFAYYAEDKEKMQGIYSNILDDYNIRLSKIQANKI